MKYWKQITFFTLLSFWGQAQSITYKVIKDQPDDVANYWVNVGLLDMGFAPGNMAYGLVGASLNGVVNYKNKIGGEFTYRTYYFNMDMDKVDGVSRNLNQIEVGAFYHLASNSKTRNQKVILSDKSNVSMKVPATIMRSYGLRAGFNSNKGTLLATMENQKVDGTFRYSSSGLYAGILITSQVNMKSHTVEYGIKGTGFVRRLYIDAIFNPIKSFEPANSNLKGSFGYRLGIQFLQPEPRKVQGSALYQKFELGAMPIDGYYFMYSLGFNFKRKIKAMSTFRPVREME